MNIWLLIWVFIAVVILGTSFWSYAILLRQKRAWQDFSKKSNLGYSAEAILKSPVLKGLYNTVPVAIFSDTATTGKSRQGGIRTVFQFTLKAPMPTEGAIASIAFKNYIDNLQLPDDVHDLGKDNLSKEIYGRVKDKSFLSEYITRERITAFNAILSIKTIPAMMIFGQNDTILRMESSDPFDNPEKLEKFLTKATEAAKVISL